MLRTAKTEAVPSSLATVTCRPIISASFRVMQDRGRLHRIVEQILSQKTFSMHPFVHV
jgi:hypothetical protein